jgi:hypothetical protein
MKSIATMKSGGEKKRESVFSKPIKFDYQLFFLLTVILDNGGSKQQKNYCNLFL